MQIVKVAVDVATYAIDKPYSYIAPTELTVSVGCRVLVPFGRGNRPTEGIVLAIEEGVPEKPLKALRENLDDEPLVTEREIHMALWMCRRYFCTFYDTIRTILPAAVWYHYQKAWQLSANQYEANTEKELTVCRFLEDGPKSVDSLYEHFGEGIEATLQALFRRNVITEHVQHRRRVQDKILRIATLAIDEEQALSMLSPRRKTAKEAVSFLAQYGDTSVQELTYFTGIGKASITSLQKAGILALYQQEAYRITEKLCAAEAPPIQLNDEQQCVYDEILNKVHDGTAGVTLLHGVTGSGKTLVYIRLAQKLLSEKKSVMILVPEIALTPQMMRRFAAYFGDEVALLHSGLRMTERYDQWKRLKRGEAHIVLGTRSAVFAPLKDLGLIIIDEEQESSYESEKSPCYHARDIAKYRAAQEGARLLLGSATPTVESSYYARRGDYQLCLLRRRYNQHDLPRVIIADMGKAVREGNVTSISRELYQELSDNIARGEQSILFLNRRGTSRQVLCPNCGFVEQCPRCSVYLTYHSANGRLMCHYCGYSKKVVNECPTCGSDMKQIGIGTQKVAEELQELFPAVQILRLDADTAVQGHEAILKKFETEKIPILIGTQMVAKGLDFENVTLVGVLAADLGLYVDHYRAAERTFGLLTQVIGRAGRGEKEGRAVIQTYTPQNSVIQSSAQQDYERFYQEEIRLRALRCEPPFQDIFSMTVIGRNENEVRRSIAALRDGLLSAVQANNFTDIKVMGPVTCAIAKLNERYRYKLTVIGKNENRLRMLLSEFMRQFAARSENRNLHIFTDCNLMD